jgi:hypothetical protein
MHLFKILIFCCAINLFEMNKFLPMLNIPTADVFVNADKAFMLQRVGAYSSKLKEEIVHSTIPLNNLCDVSPSTEVCLFILQTTPVKILELSTILPSRDTITALPRYDSDQISSIIRSDIIKLIKTHSADVFITKTNSVLSYFDNQFHLPNYITKSVLNSTQSLFNVNQSDVPRVSIGPHRTVLR